MGPRSLGMLLYNIVFLAPFFSFGTLITQTYITLKKNKPDFRISKVHVYTCQIYASCPQSFAKKTNGKMPTYTWEGAIKCILPTVQVLPKARLWDDSSHCCLCNTADLDGVTRHVAQTAPASWPQPVWTCGGDGELQLSWKPRQVRAADMEEVSISTTHYCLCD